MALNPRTIDPQLKFLYQYKTSANELRHGVARAANRDQVYADLKRQGIRPSRVEEAPGFFNKLFGKGKRWIAIAVLAVAFVLSVLFIWLGMREPSVLSRRQIVGDQWVLEDGLRRQWDGVLARQGERWLAMYAMPGRVVRGGLKSASPIEVYVAMRDLEQSMNNSVELKVSDVPEYRQLRAIVEGMKQELREHIRKGGKTLDFLEKIEARQREEVKAYEDALSNFKARVEVEGCSEGVRRYWLERNAELRAKGMMALPGPEQF